MTENSDGYLHRTGLQLDIFFWIELLIATARLSRVHVKFAVADNDQVGL